MLATAPPLPAQPLVGLLADLRAKAIQHAAHPGALALLHALICTALIRLFAGLQDLMELWRSGQLPPQTLATLAILATLAAAPPRAVASCARTLRPLGHRLGVDLPAILQPPPRPPAPAKPARRKPALLPPLLPLYSQRKPTPMPFLTPLRKFRPA